jgi:multidrug efflux pump
MPNLSEWALKNQPIVRYLFVLLLILGGLAYSQLGQRENPKFTFRAMIVNVQWPGASASEMEQQVTDRVERKLQELPKLDFLKSYSKPGESTIYIHLTGDTSPDETQKLWYEVRKKINDIKPSLPKGTLGPFFNDEFGDTYGSIYAFTADGFDHNQLKNMVKDVRQDLLSIPMVAKVNLIGVQKEKIFIEWSKHKLASLKIDPNTIIVEIQKQNSIKPAGFIETNEQRMFVRVSGDFHSVSAIENTIIEVNGKSFRIKDIATVRRGYEEPAEYRMRFMQKDAIGLAISMRKGGDVIKLGEALSVAMERLQKNLPVGVEVHQVSDQPAVVKDSIEEFVKVLIEAVVIVLAVSFISLGLRTGLVVAISIPLVLAITFLMMLFFGIELQRISLGALIIALGLLVDDAMIAVEMMVIKLEQGWSRFEAATYTFKTTAFPMLTGTLVTAAAFLPVGWAQSSAGEYTFSLFAVVVIALLVSWIVAVIFTPYIGYKILPDYKKQEEDHDVYNSRFYRSFRAGVTFCVDYKKTVVFITFCIFVLSIMGFKHVDKQFFPASNRAELLVDLTLPRGAAVQAIEAETLRLEKHLEGNQYINNFTTYIGGGTPRFYLSLSQKLKNANFAQIVIMTNNPEDREKLRLELRSYLDNEYSHLRTRISRLENGPPIGYPVQFRISGNDKERLQSYAQEMAKIMRANPNTRDVHLNWQDQSPIIQLQVDQEKARSLGVSSEHLANSLQLVLSGLTITEYREGDESIQVISRSQKEDRELLSQLKSFSIQISQGVRVPLNQIAHITVDLEPGIIWRRNNVPTVTVMADIIDSVQAPDVSTQIEKAMLDFKTNLPFPYSIETGGAKEKSGESKGPIRDVLPAVLVITLTLLMLQLKSFSRAILVLLTAPLGLIGMTLFLLILDTPFGFVAMLGGISLAGMIMRNSVILVDQIEKDVADGLSLRNAIIDSTVRRMRPILLTAAAAILAMVPLQSSIFWGPMAVVIMGGLLVATILTLFFLPALYALCFRAQ